MLIHNVSQCKTITFGMLVSSIPPFYHRVQHLEDTIGFDKQYLRDYLLSLDWDKTAPGPRLPQTVIHNTRAKYVEALTLLCGDRHGL